MLDSNTALLSQHEREQAEIDRMFTIYEPLAREELKDDLFKGDGVLALLGALSSNFKDSVSNRFSDLKEAIIENDYHEIGHLIMKSLERAADIYCDEHPEEIDKRVLRMAEESDD